LPTPTLQVCRSCGGGAPVDAHFCPQCSKILSLGRHGDYFAFLGLPRKLRIDSADLEQQFRALSRQFHPDYFYNAEPSERRASLERSSYLNDAYRALKNAASRLDYLLKIEGFGTASPEDASRQVPAGLLEEVFALNEELDEIRELRTGGAPADRWKPRLERARQPILDKQKEHEAQLGELSVRWDAVVERDGSVEERRAILSSLRNRFLERNYIANLLGTIEKELSD
jgi:molecular chaperone HscB